MPRQRMVKPEFFDSDSLAECSIPARLTFIGLWVMGDDYGNMKANVAKLQRNIYPCDDMTRKEFGMHLIELERVGCIKGYQHGGEVYINIPNFSEYQTVRKPSKTRVPAPKEDIVRTSVTHVLEQWLTSDVPVTHHDGSTAPVTHQCVTSVAQSKEGGTTYLQKKGHGGTGSAVAAPPAPEVKKIDHEINSEGASACLEALRSS